MLIAVCAGHTPIGQGAHAVDASGVELYSEHVMMSRLAAQIVDRLHHAKLYRHEALASDGQPTSTAGSVSYRATTQATVSKINKNRAVCAVFLHFNAVPEHLEGGATARDWSRALALVWPGSSARLHAPVLVRACVDAMPSVREGGVYEKRESWAGTTFYPLRDTDCPAVILEVANGANPQHAADLAAAVDDGSLADCLAIALAAWRSAIITPPTPDRRPARLRVQDV